MNGQAFPTAVEHGIYTNLHKVDGHPAVQYTRNGKDGLVWSRVVHHVEAETGLHSFDVTWSEEPGESRTIWDRDEAIAFALWLVKE